jgi:hypothetical protein
MESRILPSAPSTLGEIETHLANGIEEEDVIEWDAAARGGSTWLGPHLGGLRRLDDPGRRDLADILLSSGGTGPGGPAAGAVRGHRDPWAGRGTIPMTLHLLSPASRPVPVTRDLAGFWRSTYFDVRKDLRAAIRSTLARRSTRGGAHQPDEAARLERGNRTPQRCVTSGCQCVLRRHVQRNLGPAHRAL